MKEEELQYVINVCWSCRDTCQKALYIKYLHANKAVGPHVQTMANCIQMLQTTADLLTRNTKFVEQICDLCAQMCEDCATSCEKQETEEMQHCADLCRKTARYCRGDFGL